MKNAILSCKANSSPSTIHRSRLTAFGFTLVELLIVMALLGAMAVIFIVNYPVSQMRARDTIRKSDIRQYQTALEVYAGKNNGAYPGSDGNLKNMCITLLGSGAVCPDDPKTPGNYHYVAVGSGAGYRLWTTLESSFSGSTEYYVVFSTGVTCTNTSNSVCP